MEWLTIGFYIFCSIIVMIVAELLYNKYQTNKITREEARVDYLANAKIEADERKLANNIKLINQLTDMGY